MNSATRIEKSLKETLQNCRTNEGPPLLGEAMDYAVFPGGARVRPLLCTSVATACGDTDGRMALAAAISLELLHCASLVHDDLPCFDDANLRRGKPSVHRAFGEPIAVLTGDALIVLAFDVLAKCADVAPQRIGRVMQSVTGAIGMPGGIIAGQAWESERQVDLRVYHRSKTAALFIAACSAGAISAGRPVAPWQRVGEAIGEAYQLMDDLSDHVGCAETLGKPAGQDARLGRPTALANDTVGEIRAQVEQLINKAIDAVPPDADQEMVAHLLHKLGNRFSSSLESATAA